MYAFHPVVLQTRIYIYIICPRTRWKNRICRRFFYFFFRLFTYYLFCAITYNNIMFSNWPFQDYQQYPPQSCIRTSKNWVSCIKRTCWPSSLLVTWRPKWDISWSEWPARRRPETCITATSSVSSWNIWPIRPCSITRYTNAATRPPTRDRECDPYIDRDDPIYNINYYKSRERTYM